VFLFKPRLTDQRSGSKRPADLPPRWFRAALGTVIERDGMAIFIPNQKHPSLKDFAPRVLGPADNSDNTMMSKAEQIFRLAQKTKRDWRQNRKAERAASRAKLFKRAA
jgi:hypothetical protein